MVVEIYDSVSGNTIQRGTEGILQKGFKVDVADITQGRHGQPVVFRCMKDTESALTAVRVSLVNQGISDSVYSIFTNPTFLTSVSIGNPGYVFTELTSSSFSIPVTDSVSDYAWIDIKTHYDHSGPSKTILSLEYDFS